MYLAAGIDPAGYQKPVTGLINDNAAVSSDLA